MAGGLVKLESRLAAVEEAAARGQAPQPAAEGECKMRACLALRPSLHSVMPGCTPSPCPFCSLPQGRLPPSHAHPGAESSQRLLTRVAAMEAAMAEQSRAVTDLLAALGTQGSAASQHVASAVAAVQAAAAAPALAAPVEAAAPHKAAEQVVAAGGEQARAAPEPPISQQQQQEQEPAPPAAQLVQRRAAAARKSLLGEPGRSSSGGGEPAAGPAGSRQLALPRLKPTHAAGTAQHIAMATARERLARQAARAHEEAEADSSALLTTLHVFGWGLLVLLGLGAVLMGVVAALMQSGRLTEADLAFLWERPAGRR